MVFIIMPYKPREVWLSAKLEIELLFIKKASVIKNCMRMRKQNMKVFLFFIFIFLYESCYLFKQITLSVQLHATKMHGSNYDMIAAY